MGLCALVPRLQAPRLSLITIFSCSMSLTSMMAWWYDSAWQYAEDTGRTLIRGAQTQLLCISSPWPPNPKQTPPTAAIPAIQPCLRTRYRVCSNFSRCFDCELAHWGPSKDMPPMVTGFTLELPWLPHWQAHSWRHANLILCQVK